MGIMTKRADLWRWAATGALLLCGYLAVEGAAGDSVATEYARRLRSLEADDLQGHYQLALWCKEQDAYRLVLKQCDYILRKNRDHVKAKLLRRLARKQLAAEAERQSAARGSKARGGVPGRLVTDQEIQTLRRRELKLDQPERVSVEFHNNVRDEFLAEMLDETEGNEEFEAAYSRRDFLRLRPPEKAQVILEFAPDTFGQDVEITSDPELFRTFAREVLPVAVRTCATSGCHDEEGQGRWRIHTGRRLTTNEVYTNYLIMHGFEVDNKRLINRDFPAQSLLLQYSLPPAEDDTDELSNHPIDIKPPFRNERDRRYVQMLDWIDSLTIPTPDYGISLTGSGGSN